MIFNNFSITYSCIAYSLLEELCENGLIFDAETEWQRPGPWGTFGGYIGQDAERAKIERMGNGCPVPIRLGSLGSAVSFPTASGRSSPGRKRICRISSVIQNASGGRISLYFRKAYIGPCFWTGHFTSYRLASNNVIGLMCWACTVIDLRLVQKNKTPNSLVHNFAK